jgi:hypothetical protein
MYRKDCRYMSKRTKSKSFSAKKNPQIMFKFRFKEFPAKLIIAHLSCIRHASRSGGESAAPACQPGCRQALEDPPGHCRRPSDFGPGSSPHQPPPDDHLRGTACITTLSTQLPTPGGTGTSNVKPRSALYTPSTTSQSSLVDTQTDAENGANSSSHQCTSRT